MTGSSRPRSRWPLALSRRDARRGASRGAWSVLTPVVALLAGLLFTTTATTAAGTELRNDRRPELTNLIAERKRDVAGLDAQAGVLRRDIETLTGAQAGSDARVADQRTRSDAEREPAGLTALHGSGLTVR